MKKSRRDTAGALKALRIREKIREKTREKEQERTRGMKQEKSRWHPGKMIADGFKKLACIFAEDRLK